MKLDASLPTSSARSTSIGSVRSVVCAMCSVVAVSCRIGRVNRPASHHPTSAAIAIAITPIATSPLRSPSSASSISARFRATCTAPKFVVSVSIR